MVIADDVDDGIVEGGLELDGVAVDAHEIAQERERAIFRGSSSGDGGEQSEEEALHRAHGAGMWER
jgi:hypothetical protein